jgi:hypothetical protein
MTNPKAARAINGIETNPNSQTCRSAQGASTVQNEVTLGYACNHEW